MNSIDEGRATGVAMAQHVALITGAGKRIGAATATRLLDAGWFVLLHVRSSEKAARQHLLEYEEKSGSPARATVLKADLDSDEDLQHLISQVQQHPAVLESGGLHGLIHNASIYSSEDFESVSLESIRLNNRIHIEVPLLLTQALLPQLSAASGSVIGMVDTSLGRSWKGLSHYTASKAGLRQLMLNLAGELAPQIRVNCVAPGAIMAAQWEAEHFASLIPKIPLGRAGEASDVANAVHFLLTSPYITGQTISVDGGWTLTS